jgi:pimeloyl-ACP methyl ester carboxylesterase
MLWMLPTQIIGFWLRGLMTFAVIGLAIYCGYQWYDQSWVYDRGLDRYVFEPRWGANATTWFFVGAVVLTIWALLGGFVLRLVMRMASGKSGRIDPALTDDATGSTTQFLDRPDGSRLYVEMHGPADAQPIVFIHGWGANRTEWGYAKRHLGHKYRLILWDLPGLGRSTAPANRDYRLENLADDLRAVMSLAGDRRVVLVGHSIGGMICLTYAKTLGQEMAQRVAGLALVHTTYTNPVRTSRHAALFTALEKPLLVPLMHLAIWLAPLVWLMNQLSYLNGSAHKSSFQTGYFSLKAWDRVEWATRLMTQAWPAVTARGMLGMIRYDATHVLSSISVPTLVIPADHDPLCTPEASQYMASRIPGADLAALPAAKHMGHTEHDAEFARLLDGFAAVCGSRTDDLHTLVTPHV